MLYIFWFLHQTTTWWQGAQLQYRLYIFWFLHQTTTVKPIGEELQQLYIFWFLHQTTTWMMLFTFASWLYIFWFLHQTTTTSCKECSCWSCISFDSYIKPQLRSILPFLPGSCISFDSYIKPQLNLCTSAHPHVVYLLIPTSNHNCFIVWMFSLRLYIFWFLHQTTTLCRFYLFWLCCISFDSYIKPQLRPESTYLISVVYLLIPTSNHNWRVFQTFKLMAVYLLIPTSNHNCFWFCVYSRWLYIFWFLHQTTT